MVHSRTTNFRNLAAQFFLGSIALASMTLAFFRLGVDLASTAFAYLIVIVLFALTDSFIASPLLAVISVAGLVYVFVPPIFELWIGKPQHIMVVVALLLSSSIVMRLIRRGRERTEAALQAEAYLWRREAYLRDSEKQRREFYDRSPAMYFMIDATRTVPSANSVVSSLITLSRTSKEND
jgi:K+-sensing histidine kinase KdpD